MSTPWSHILLAIALGALLGAGVRIASPACPRGLARAVAAAVIATGAVVLWSLALGLAGLGLGPAVLAVAAVATWLAARLALPAPVQPVAGELSSWWAGLGTRDRTILGAIAGAWVAYVAWLLRFPSLGLDGTVYHLTEAVDWVHGGNPGSIQRITYEFPVGAYPVTNEVVLAWLLGIARGMAPMAVWTPVMLALAATAGWLGLRELRVPRPAAALAVAAVCTVPVGVDQLRGPSTDIPALAWLLATAALTASSRRHPGLLAPAVVAAGLAVGTKTTTLPFAVACLALALVANRERLRPAAPALVGALAAALAIGGFWYLRNLVRHGSPFWPFVTAPWGDPLPPYLRHFDVSLLDRPGATLSGRLDDYARLLAGGLALVGGALVAPLVARRRSVLAAAAATLAGALLWARAPFSGYSGFNRALDLSLSTTRYLLPTVAAAGLALGLAARERGWVGRAATVLLAAGVGWNLMQAAQLRFPIAPSILTPLAGAAAGALAALALSLVVGRLRKASAPSRGRAVAVGALLTVLVALLLSAGSRGFVARHARAPGFDQALSAWFARQPAFGDGGRLVSFAPAPFGVLTGDRLQHRLEVIPADASCREVELRLRRGWVVIREDPFQPLLTPFTASACLSGRRPVFDDGRSSFRVYTGLPA